MTADIPAYHVAAGNPARVVKRLPDETSPPDTGSEGGTKGDTVATAINSSMASIKVISTLQDALLAGLGDQEQGEALERIVEVARDIEEWAKARKRFWAGHPEII